MSCEKPTIAIIDDDESMVQLLTTILKREFEGEFNIVASSNPEQADGLCLGTEADLCITDLEMPRINGFRLLSNLKRRNSLTQVLILTAHPSENALRSAFQLGADEYILKPVKKDELIEAVRYLTNRIERYRRDIMSQEHCTATIPTIVVTNTPASCAI